MARFGIVEWAVGLLILVIIVFSVLIPEVQNQIANLSGPEKALAGIVPLLLVVTVLRATGRI